MKTASAVRGFRASNNDGLNTDQTPMKLREFQVERRPGHHHPRLPPNPLSWARELLREGKANLEGKDELGRDLPQGPDLVRALSSFRSAGNVVRMTSLHPERNSIAVEALHLYRVTLHNIRGQERGISLSGLTTAIANGTVEGVLSSFSLAARESDAYMLRLHLQHLDGDPSAPTRITEERTHRNTIGAIACESGFKAEIKAAGIPPIGP